MVSRRWPIALGAWALANVFGAPACGTDAHGADPCRKIEQARCRKAGASCPELGLQGSTGVEECVQYARDRCLHGLAVPDPGVPAVDACVIAIEQATTCDIVAKPELAPACAFLQPIPVPVDAGPDTPAEDAADLDAPGTTEGG
jgi:hypothetical protein